MCLFFFKVYGRIIPHIDRGIGSLKYIIMLLKMIAFFFAVNSYGPE